MMPRRLLLVLLLAGSGQGAHAARPMITDDARLVDPGACQLESWVQFLRDETIGWALPACNPGGNFELTVGGALARPQGASTEGAYLIQGKTLFKALEPGGWGAGLAAGYATQPGQGTRDGSPYAYVPLSLSLADDRAVIHLNPGIIRRREIGDTRLTWGVGGEFALSERAWLIAESFGQDKGSGFYQGGMRVWIIPGHVQLDATYGSSFAESRDDRWFSLGLRLISPRIF